MDYSSYVGNAEYGYKDTQWEMKRIGIDETRRKGQGFAGLLSALARLVTWLPKWKRHSCGYRMTRTTSIPLKLNYAILGHDNIFDLPIHDESSTVGDVLRTVTPGFKVPAVEVDFG